MEAKRTSERAKNLTTINAVAISIFAAFNPLLAHVANPVVDWALSIVSAGLFGLVACWLYLKLTRQQKPDSLAKGTALAAWFFMANWCWCRTWIKPKSKALRHRRKPMSTGLLSQLFGAHLQTRKSDSLQSRASSRTRSSVFFLLATRTATAPSQSHSRWPLGQFARCTPAPLRAAPCPVALVVVVLQRPTSPLPPAPSGRCSESRYPCW